VRMAATHSIDSRSRPLLAGAALCLLLVIQAGCALRGSTVRSGAPGGGLRDTLAVIPFGSAQGYDVSARTAICEALGSGAHSYTIAIQPAAQTDQRLRAAGWAPRWDLWQIKTHSLYYGIHHLETDSSMSLSRMTGARFVMIGAVNTYGMAFSATYEGVDLNVSIYDGRSGKRIWSHSDQGLHEAFSSPEALKQRVGERVAGQVPFARR
jgi:hypothetical protein